MAKSRTIIAFSSCCKIQRRREQIAWKWIEEDRPDLLLLLGDNVYARNSGWDIDYLREKYESQAAVPNFKNLTANVDMLATWDDHDLGPDNAKGATADAQKIGKSGKQRRDEARDLLLEFLPANVSIPENLSQPIGEIYCRYTIDGIRVIMLDTRYYREDAKEYPNAQLLGPIQETWLWNELNSAAQDGSLATIVCAGSTIDMGSKPSESISDYSRFYEEFTKRFRECPNPIFLSGDIHQNNIRVHDGFLEITSSGVAQRRRYGLFDAKTKNLNNRGILYVHEDHIRVRLRGSDKADEVFEFPLKDTLPTKKHLNEIVWRERD